MKCRVTSCPPYYFACYLEPGVPCPQEKFKTILRLTIQAPHSAINRQVQILICLNPRCVEFKSSRKSNCSNLCPGSCTIGLGQVACNVQVLAKAGPLLTSRPAQPITYLQMFMFIFKSPIENLTSLIRCRS